MVTFWTSKVSKNLLTHRTLLSGDLMYITAFGQGILVINSQRVAVDLLEKRSNIYSDRPRNISLNEFLTENLTFVFTSYGELCVIRHCLIPALTLNRWRRFRRPAVEGFSKSVVQDFYPIQSREAIMLALSLMKSPPMKKHFQRRAWSIVLSLNYHLPPVESEDDPVIVAIADHVLRGLHEMQPGNRLVEYFPWMRYIPSRYVCRVTYLGASYRRAYRREIQVRQVETGCTVLVHTRLPATRTSSE